MPKRGSNRCAGLTKAGKPCPAAATEGPERRAYERSRHES